MYSTRNSFFVKMALASFGSMAQRFTCKLPDTRSCILFGAIANTNTISYVLVCRPAQGFNRSVIHVVRSRLL